MMQLKQVVSVYGATRGSLTKRDGGTEESTGSGGGLVSAVEQQGLDTLAASMSEGDTLVLEDAGVSLTLTRERVTARMRVSWADGPNYEETIRVDGVAAPAPMPTTAPTAVAAPVASAATPLFTPDPAAAVTSLTEALHSNDLPLYVSASGVYTGGQFGAGEPLLGIVPPISGDALGADSFRAAHGVRAAYVSGAMAGGIGSAEIVIAMGQAGMLGFYGAGGLPLPVVEKDVARIKETLGDRPAGFNLLHNPVEPKVEMGTVEMFLKYGCRFVSASAFMTLTPAIVRYRTAGIHKDASGAIVCPNKVFAKVSRAEVAEPFMRPPSKALLEQCVGEGWLTPDEAVLAAQVPMAEDITAEADSGGHTDRRPLVVLLPTLQRLRDRVMAEEGYADRGIHLRVGAAGGIGDPESAYGALAMGADYLLTGSINQSSVEAGTSELAKSMVAQAGMADVATGPAPDMFEIGAHVQVLSRGSMYAQRAGRLHDLYKRFGSMEEIPTKDREKIEKTIFKRTFDDVWEGTRAYWAERDPAEVERAERDGRHKMALTFRWYLGMTSRWARTGETDRKRDYQIWCGPSMGSFNDWVRGTWLESLESRRVVDIAGAILHGAASLRRVETARTLGVNVPSAADHPTPHRS
jgi:trans-AT polyketide synthase/acyltransferase/oxidoreductase domain-containing protein